MILTGVLPANAVVTGSLSFFNCSPVFPPGIHITGNLRVMCCGRGTRLAPGMTVGGVADFTQTPLRRLPPRFTVGVCLDVNDTFIREFPPDLKVGQLIQVSRSAPAAMHAFAATVNNSSL